jgi:hypothetical protein
LVDTLKAGAKPSAAPVNASVTDAGQDPHPRVQVPARRVDCLTALEAGDFDRAQKLVRGAGDRYVEALMWADDAAGPLFETVEAAAA